MVGSVLLCGLVLGAMPAAAQVSTHALRFYGTGANPPGQQDRVRIPIDDNLPGAAGSTQLDLGVGSMTIELWVRGTVNDNDTSSSPGGGDAEFFDFRWIEGNIIVDRDIWGPSSRDWGVSIAGGRVRFGTGRADSGALDSEHTIEGSINVLNARWRHIAVVRNASTGVKSIYVDGVLDYASPPNRSRDDISFPDAGVSGQQTPWGPFIVLAAEKHDAGLDYPSFSGWMDEVRFWNVARTPGEIAADARRILPADTPGLVGAYRFEEGSGTVVSSSTTVPAPSGQLIAGTVGNGEWSARATSRFNAAPVGCVADHDGSGAVDVVDLFQYLDEWFATSGQVALPPLPELAADTDRNDSVNVVDLFLFLDAWFAPCGG